MWTQTFDHHTHTLYSHGILRPHAKGTIEENVKAAYEKGLRSIAITDHGPGHLTYGVKHEDFPKMREEIDRLQEAYPDMRILLGVEANIWDKGSGLDIQDRDLPYLDLVLAGYHYGVTNGHCVQNYLQDKGFRGGEERLREKNTRMILRAIEENSIQILTHPGDKGPFDIGQIAEACAKHQVLMEINTHHPHLSVEEIKIAAAYDVQFIIGSDAHRPQDVGKVEEAIRRAQEGGLSLSRLVNVEER